MSSFYFYKESVQEEISLQVLQSGRFLMLLRKGRAVGGPQFDNSRPRFTAADEHHRLFGERGFSTNLHESIDSVVWFGNLQFAVSLLGESLTDFLRKDGRWSSTKIQRRFLLLIEARIFL